MINTYEQLLQRLLQLGIQDNTDAQHSLGLTHPNHLGNMYEGLARNILEASIFGNFDLRVCSGMIRGPNGNSGQIDCIIGIGPGIQLPNTNEFVYDIDNVLAVVEVKKTHSRHLLGEDVEKLTAIPTLVDLEHPGPQEKQTLRALLDATRASFGREKWHVAPTGEELTADSALRLTILADARTPLRIVLGFGGFQTESGFRDALNSCLSTQITCAIDHMPNLLHLPNLVISGKFYAFKANGLPFPPEPFREGYGLYYSSNDGSLRALLNMLWYRIAMRFDRNHSWFAAPPRFSSPLIGVSDCGSSQGIQVTKIQLTERTLACRHTHPASDAPFVSIETFVLFREIINKELYSPEDPAEFARRLWSKCVEFLTTFPLYSAHLWREEFDTPDALASWVLRNKLFEIQDTQLKCAAQVPACWLVPFGVLACENRLGNLSQLSPEFLQQELSEVQDTGSQPSFIAYFKEADSTVGPPVIDDAYFAYTLRRLSIVAELCQRYGYQLRIAICYGQSSPVFAQRDGRDVLLRIHVDLLRELQRGARIVLRNPSSFVAVGKSASCLPFAKPKPNSEIPAIFSSLKVLPTQPECPKRAAFAEEAVIWALIFAALHSVAHVLQCHDTIDGNSFFENGTLAVAPEAALALELAADSFALTCFRTIVTQTPSRDRQYVGLYMVLGASLLLQRTNWAGAYSIPTAARKLHWFFASCRATEKKLGLDKVFIEVGKAIAKAIPSEKIPLPIDDIQDAREKAGKVWTAQLRPVLEGVSVIELMKFGVEPEL